MAGDQETLALLRRLHAGLPVEFVVLDAEQARDDAVLKAPPRDGYAVAMRVADVGHREEKLGETTVPVRVVAYSHAVKITDGVGPTTADSFAAFAEDMKRAPSPGEPLSLAMEDYTIRHAPGWAVVGGPVFRDEKLPARVEEQRQDLDRRIKECADRAKAYYGERPGRE